MWKRYELHLPVLTKNGVEKVLIEKPAAQLVAGRFFFGGILKEGLTVYFYK